MKIEQLLNNISRTLRPNEQETLHAQEQFLSFIYETFPQPQFSMNRTSGSLFANLFSVSVATVGGILIAVMMVTGIAEATSRSLPGSRLYAMKLATEEIQLSLTFNDLAKARLQLQFSQRRVNELETLARSNNGSQGSATAYLFEQGVKQSRQSLATLNAHGDSEHALEIAKGMDEVIQRYRQVAQVQAPDHTAVKNVADLNTEALQYIVEHREEHKQLVDDKELEARLTQHLALIEKNVAQVEREHNLQPSEKRVQFKKQVTQEGAVGVAQVPDQDHNSQIKKEQEDAQKKTAQARKAIDEAKDDLLHKRYAEVLKKANETQELLDEVQ